MEAQGISLWWMPPDPEPLQALIDALARTHGTPRFQPRVTLVGRLLVPQDDVMAGAAALARELVPADGKFRPSCRHRSGRHCGRASARHGGAPPGARGGGGPSHGAGDREPPSNKG